MNFFLPAAHFDETSGVLAFSALVPMMGAISRQGSFFLLHLQNGGDIQSVAMNSTSGLPYRGRTSLQRDLFVLSDQNAGYGNGGHKSAICG